MTLAEQNQASEDQQNSAAATSPESTTTDITATPASTEAGAAQAGAAETGAGETAQPNDGLERFRQLMRSRENVNARVIKWQRNGLEMELEDGTKAFMPNDMIDRDPNRNVANYFSKTLPVRVTSVKTPQPGSKKADITVSHRAVLDDAIRAEGKEKIQSFNNGDVIEVKIKGFNKDGATVDLGAGIEAIIRTRDLSWEHIDHPYEAVKRGDTIQAKILQVDKGRRRVQLGVRQLTADPYVEKFGKYEQNQTVTGTVTKTNEYGAEVELEEGIIAFLPISEIAWNRIDRVEDVVKSGDSLEAKIITSDLDKRKLTLSRRALIENPMRKIESTFRVGTDHDGVIKEVNRGGVVVTLEHDAEGFVPRRELSHDRIERLEEVFKTGKPLENLRVIEYDRRNGKVTLSLIEAEREAQKKTLKNYKATSSASSFTIGDLASLKEKLEKIEKGG